MTTLVGQRFGRLLVLRQDRTAGGKAHWLCRCDCNKQSVVRGTHLRLGKVRSCGCLVKKPRDSVRVEGPNAFISLTNGKTAVVDAQDADLGRLAWRAIFIHAHWYAERTMKSRGSKTTIRLHRVVAERAGMSIDGLHVDHKDTDTLNCRRNNLRPATCSQNGANRGAQVNSASGIKGVDWVWGRDKWRAQIGVRGRRVFLGYFDSSEQAAAAYAAAAQALHCDFARTGT